LFNLLDNAVKFTSVGSVMLSATLESKSNDGTLVRVSIADTGIGIPPQKQKYLFEPFRPADDAAASGTFGGHGLGLAISRKLVELMGGSIEFQSQLGAGTTFQFTAWFRKAESLRAQEEKPQQRGASAHLSILVAEDNAVNRRLLTKILETAGHRVTCASTGKEAVQQFAAQGFDLILMDMEMPDMDGLEATQIIRATEPATAHVPIYAITAHTMPGDRERCFAAGMDGFLSKPVEVDAVLKIASDLASPSPGEEVQVVS
jgi:CheY-like chemotaxis protein